MNADERTDGWVSIGAALMALVVLTGALGAHMLGPHFVEKGAEWWGKAVLYHALHALGVLVYGLYLRGRANRPWPACCFAIGILLFSGSLYAMALGAPTWLGMITPVGGTLWIVAWIGFAAQARLAYPRAPKATR
ncbi:MAG: DUF423 domain-containing protein [Planctomycetes bacterium]|nr:DUF423 domain-containing protein [Planctomycetota bacterium]